MDPAAASFGRVLIGIEGLARLWGDEPALIRRALDLVAPWLPGRPRTGIGNTRFGAAMAARAGAGAIPVGGRREEAAFLAPLPLGWLPATGADAGAPARPGPALDGRAGGAGSLGGHRPLRRGGRRTCMTWSGAWTGGRCGPAVRWSTWPRRRSWSPRWRAGAAALRAPPSLRHALRAARRRGAPVQPGPRSRCGWTRRVVGPEPVILRLPAGPAGAGCGGRPAGAAAHGSPGGSASGCAGGRASAWSWPGAAPEAGQQLALFERQLGPGRPAGVAAGQPGHPLRRGSHPACQHRRSRGAPRRAPLPAGSRRAAATPRA